MVGVKQRAQLDIVEAIRAEVGDGPATAGVYAKHLGTGETIALDADVQTATASTFKVPVLLELFCQADAGEVDLAAPLAAAPDAHVLGSGILRDLSPGLSLPVRDVATLMIVLSDNIATNMLLDLVGIDRINASMEAWGFRQTEIRGRIDFDRIGDDPKRLAVSSPADLAGMMEALATGRILSAAGRDGALDILSRQHMLDKIPRYLPYERYRDEEKDNGLRIANKTGSMTGFRADTALVEWPGTRYVVAVCVTGDPDPRFWAENSGDRLVGRISRRIFEHFGGSALAEIA